MFKILIFYVAFVISVNNSAKILGVFLLPAISHHVVFRTLMLELAKRGHEVTVITTDPVFTKGNAPQNLTEIDLHDISYSVWKKIVSENNENKQESLKMFVFILDLITRTFEAQLNSVELQKFLPSDKRFDLLIYESCVRPSLVFSHKYNIPAIEFSTLSTVFSTLEMMGAAAHPLLYPDTMHRRIYNLTLWEKVNELYLHYSSQYIFYKHEYIDNQMLKNIFEENTPNLSDLEKYIHMLFLAIHPVWDFNRPVPPNVLYLGSIHQKPEKNLSQDLKSYLDSSKNGVIYISFGTNIIPSTLTPEKIKIFTRVFSRLPYNIIWKWDKDELPDRSENIRISKWLPQADLLRHPNVKLFITQGGLQSTDEALTAGVPLIGIPLHADQWFNTEQYVKFDIDAQLCIRTLTEDKFKNAIETVFDNKRLRDNMVGLHKLINDQPQTPLERAVWWTEYVLRHSGDKRLRTSTAGISRSEYYERDVALFLIGSLIFFLMFVYVTTYYIVVKIKYYLTLKIKVN